MERKVTVEKNGNVLLLGLNRPQKLNSFDVDMFMELSLALGELNADPECRCGLLHAHGNHFTSGLDLTQWAALFENGIFPPPLPEGACDIYGLDEARRVQKPLVMAVQGFCFTIGLEILLAADIRVAAADSRFALLEVKRGIYPAGGATIRLHREIGWGNAMRYLLTGDEMLADEAFRLGLIQEITENGRQLDRAFEIAETVAKRAPLGVRAALMSARHVQASGEGPAVERLIPDFMNLMKSEDAAEGVRSFTERREARFKGR
jgi:enoyl-CoA hydratase